MKLAWNELPLSKATWVPNLLRWLPAEGLIAYCFLKDFLTIEQFQVISKCDSHTQCLWVSKYGVT